VKKSAYFASDAFEEWPRPRDIEHYFLAPPGKRWFFETGNDGGYLDVEGVDGTEHLEEGHGGRKDITLWVTGHPKFGVMLNWHKWDGKQNHGYHSRGDLRRLRELVRNMHGTAAPVGLFIPYEEAWKAVKEFLENDGALPKSIAWISDDDLPPDTFPDPSPFPDSSTT
jgi:hypothetical protein